MSKDQEGSPIGAKMVAPEDQETAAQIVNATIGLIAQVARAHEKQSIGIGLAMGAMLQGLLIMMIAAGKPGTDGDKAIALLTEQLTLNKEKAERTAAQMQRDMHVARGETIQ